MLMDPVADMLTRIRNAQNVGRSFVSMPASQLKKSIAAVLQKEGFIQSYEVSEEVKPVMTINLKYHNGRPVIEMIKRVSRPGLRIYKSSQDIPLVMGGLGVAIVSTSKGVMSDKQARALNVGGEVLCVVA